MPIQHIATSDIALAIRMGFAWRLEFSQSINNGATVLLGVTTGTRGAILSDRSFFAVSTTAVFSLYRNTSFTGGSALAMRNRSDRFWNDTTRSPFVGGTAWSGVTATPAAADLMSSLTLMSATPTSQAIGNDASEMVLAPNTSYVIAVQNAGSNPAVCGLSVIVLQDHLTDGSLR